MRAFITLLLIEVCFAQTVFDMSTLRLVSNTYQATTAEMIKKQGVFIRTKWNDGCLDAGCCNVGFGQMLFNQDCPTWGWMKFSFNGPMIMAHKPVLNMCIECKDGQRNCQVGTSRCSGIRAQQWHLGLFLERTTGQGDVLFTIVSSMFPEQCVTIDQTSEKGGLVLQDCAFPPTEHQLFYINRDWFQTVIASQKLVDSGSTPFNSLNATIRHQRRRRRDIQEPLWQVWRSA